MNQLGRDCVVTSCRSHASIGLGFPTSEGSEMLNTSSAKVDGINQRNPYTSA